MPSLLMFCINVAKNTPDLKKCMYSNSKRVECKMFYVVDCEFQFPTKCSFVRCFCCFFFIGPVFIAFYQVRTSYNS